MQNGIMNMKIKIEKMKNKHLNKNMINDMNKWYQINEIVVNEDKALSRVSRGYVVEQIRADWV